MKTTITFTGLELATLRHAMELEIAQMPKEAKKDYASALLEKLSHSSQNRETFGGVNCSRCGNFIKTNHPLKPGVLCNHCDFADQ